MPDVICNTSPLQYLHQADVLELLPALVGQVYVPEAVVAELREGRRRNVRLPNLEALSWLTVRPVHDRTLLPLVTYLGDGEKVIPSSPVLHILKFLKRKKDDTGRDPVLPQHLPHRSPQDEAAFGTYRTRDMTLAYMNALAAGDVEAVVIV